MGQLTAVVNEDSNTRTNHRLVQLAYPDQVCSKIPAWCIKIPFRSFQNLGRLEFAVGDSARSFKDFSTF